MYVQLKSKGFNVCYVILGVMCIGVCINLCGNMQCVVCLCRETFVQSVHQLSKVDDKRLPKSIRYPGVHDTRTSMDKLIDQKD